MEDKNKISFIDAVTGKKIFGEQLLETLKDHPVKSALLYGFIKGSKEKLEKRKQKEEDKKKNKK